MQYDANLEEADQAQKRADALLRTQQTQRTPATILVPTNCGQELYDVITVTDPRCGIDQQKYRVLAILTDYDRHQGRYEQKLSLAAP
jgi:TPP-dependent 2-oxoacid decarboxylase